MTRKRARVITALLLSFFLGIVLVTALRQPDVQEQVDESVIKPIKHKMVALTKSLTGDTDAGASDAATDAAEAGVADAADLMAFNRPLRVASYGWELVAPGIVANMGATPGPASMYGASGLTVYLNGVETMARLETALAKGGAQEGGADIAIAPLPLVIAAFERIHALDPQIFYVVGWSRGREAVLSSVDTLGPYPTGKDLPALTDNQDLPVFLGLFSMSLAGADSSHVRMLKLTTPHSEEIPLAFIDRLFTPEAIDSARRKILFTTVDAANLIPIVAVAQRGLVEHHSEMLALWTRVWIDGQTMLQADVTAGARLVAKAPGALDEVNVLTRLGQVQPATVAENARLAGLAGRSPLTLDAMFQRTWQIWRSSGTLATPPPGASPVSSKVVASLARQVDPSMKRTDPLRGSAAPLRDGVAKDLGPAGTATPIAPILVREEPDGPEGRENLLRNIGFIAGVFERSPLRITAGKGDTQELLDVAALRYGIPKVRLLVGQAKASKAAGVIEILPAQ